MVVSNPPWDIRIEGADEAWGALSSFLRREAAPSTAYLLSGNAEVNATTEYPDPDPDP